MNYEEKVKKYRDLIKHEIKGATDKAAYYYDIEPDTAYHNAYEGARKALLMCQEEFEEIFGKVSRSGVGENEESKEDFFPPFLLCTKFPFCKVQCAKCKEHEPTEKSD